ncbi:MAG: hypothetical protein WAM14_22330, partial [Candidatus Nitrosopolaris sp.]
ITTGRFVLILSSLQLLRNLNPVETRVNRNLKEDVCANHNYATEENLTNAVRRYLRRIGSWPKL